MNCPTARLDLRFIVSVAALLAFLSLSPAAPAQEQVEKKPFFLPQNPTAASYILGRLSTKELIEAPRSEFVFVALLQRSGLDRKYRLEALEGLAKLRTTDALAELIRGVSELEKKGEEAEPVLRDLASILLQTKPAELAAKRASLEKLTSEGQLALSRQMAFAALITADGAVEATWKQNESNSSQVADLLLSIPLIRDEKLRATFYPKVEPLLQKSDSDEVRRAAITAAAFVPGHEVEAFSALASLVKSGTERSTAVASLQKIPRKHWPKEHAEALVESLIGFLKDTPVEQRTESDFVNAFQLTSDLASLLPPEKSKVVNQTLRDLGVSIVVIRAIYEQMLYDKQLIVVEAGKPVEITLVNDDAMPHNLVVVKPGAAGEIGEAAEKMPPEPDAQGRLHVPDSPLVLHATKMVDPGQRVKLSFTAPQEMGDYQYVCTFPGHWRRMVGTLAVVKDVEAYLASHAAALEPKMTAWKLDDFVSDLAQAGTGRNLANGQELFTKTACATCHKLGQTGINYGPDLSEVFKRHKNDRAAVLRQILEPSTVIDDRYRSVQFALNNGDSVMGLVVKEDAESVTIQIGPSDALIQTLKKSDIKSRQPLSSSVMPMGLLNMLSKEQILDLLAYLESGGNSQQAHNH